MLPNAPTGIIPWNARLTNYPWLYNHVARLSGTCQLDPNDKRPRLSIQAGGVVVQGIYAERAEDVA